jgi:hypothetical protein
MHTKVWFALTMAALLLVSPALAAELDRSWNLNSGERLEFRLDDGRIEVSAWDQNQVALHLETKGWEIGPGGAELIEKSTGEGLNIRIKLPKRKWSWGGDNRSVVAELRVPRNLLGEISTGDGRILATGMTGEFRLRTGDGRIRAESVTGAVELDTGDGRIEVLGFQGRLNAHTGHGSIRAEGVFEDLRLRTGDGSIQLVAESGTSLTESASVRTGDGNIRARLDPGLRLTLHADTGDGRISSDLPLQVQRMDSTRRLQGTLNGGGPELTLRTGDGNIAVTN